MRQTPIHTVHPSDGIIAAAMLTGTYCCKSWAYTVLRIEEAVHKNTGSRNCRSFKTKNKKHEPKLTKNIQIKHFSTTTLCIEVAAIYTGSSQKHLFSISRQRFELWLYQTCRLDWCTTEIDYKPALNHDNTTMPYWPYNDYGITLQDLLTYIIDTGLADQNHAA